ncbi:MULTISPECIES: lysylphosphatidylglycerol synthase transmembrane domain-containing protein [Pseudomonas]|uniref:lysylphosphatidylglycerol synthase transmembrane domain-containing protein n=1 Tax=Pseudomonas TaxID=286 RepID=UPI000CDA9142|nr:MULTISPECIES: lysylphosphatidylglycerol synthase transmembrane domain-containing protein [Pseudomonas]MCK3834090.1 flippase-like domain-containing protein [Pseudomonas fluorescens]QUW67738.1 flippase-like domain-containing protein [Pseudomonas synxantha]
MSRLIWLLLALLVALLIPVWLGGGETVARLRQFPLPQLVGMFAMIIGCWLINSLRLRLLLGEQGSQLGRLKSLGAVISTEFAMCATPGGSGGPLTLMALLARNGIRPARASAVFAMDQLSDLLFFLCALAGIVLYALFHSLNPRLEWLLGLSVISMIGGIISGLAVVRFHRRLIRLAGAMLKAIRVRAPTRRRWARRLLRFLAAFTATLKLPWPLLLGVFALTSLHWLLRYSVLYLALRGLGGDVQWALSFLIQMLSLTAGQFSLLPGGAGAAELTSAALLAPMVGKSTAAAAILIWRAVTYYFYLLAGAPVFVLMVGKPLFKRLLQGRQAARPAPAAVPTNGPHRETQYHPRRPVPAGRSDSDNPRPP